MKLDFPVDTTNNRTTTYCIYCHSSGIETTKSKGKTEYICRNCGKRSDRAIIIDPDIIWWIDPATKEHWHKSVGIFIFNKEGKFLIFKLQKYPYKYTIPAGHINVQETPEDAARRETLEETSLAISRLSLLGEDDIQNDSCRRGSDHHHWFTFLAIIVNTDNLNINDEGVKPIWLTTQEAERLDLTVPVRFVFEKYKGFFPN
jgi:ADP-ribose pyrophosphatase YjhB (NUDIX family)